VRFLFATGRALIYAVFCGEGALVALTIYGTLIGAPLGAGHVGLSPMNFFLAGFGAAIVVQVINAGLSKRQRRG
jgi:hypothetical protein